MRRILLASVLVGACTQTPGTPPDQGLGLLPPSLTADMGLSLTVTPVNVAVVTASAYYADAPRRLGGNPALAAQVAAQYEYAAAELRGPQYVGLSPLTTIELDWGREELRDVLGVRQDAPPRAVVEGLVGAARALRAGDRAAAEAALSGPIFVRPAPAILATLEQMPPVPRAGRGARTAEIELTRPNGSERRVVP